jgi:hypothetical protein
VASGGQWWLGVRARSCGHGEGAMRQSVARKEVNKEADEFMEFGVVTKQRLGKTQENKKN